jgi:DNA repair protein RecN (Recombination protein N)
MLTKLFIQNIALIKDLSITFKKGLNIITGETGSGKSVMINAIKAVIGDRVYREMIRTGSETATVEAEFLPKPYIIDAVRAFGIDAEYDRPLVLYREIHRSGRNVCKINGTSVTVTDLFKTGTLLVDIHGQFDSRNLVSPETHIHVLDQFGQSKIEDLMEKYRTRLDLFRNTIQQLKRYALSETELERKIDMLEYQVNEIEFASLKENEEEELKEKRSLLINAEKILNALQSAHEMLFGSEMNAASLIHQAVSQISSVSDFKKEFREMEESLREITYNLEDLKYTLMDSTDRIEFNPAKLEEIEDRLETIKLLKKKYGDSIPKILEYGKEAKKELELLKNSGEIIEELRNKIRKQKEELYDQAKQISNLRREIASVLEEKIAKELDDMEMKKTVFQVSIDFPEFQDVADTDFTEYGLDEVEFLISPNPGEPLKPLAKIASGGELSRMMLALKTLLSDYNKIPVMIFDEIDAGISGEAALQTGRKIYEISKNCQVICVTHMPQIACMADSHFVIKKESIGGNSYTFIEEIFGEKCAEQLAAMLDGNIVTESGLAHAHDMLEKAVEYKSGNINC